MAKLTERQRKALDEYLVEKKVLINTTVTLTTSELCEWVREGCKFSVDTSNITHRVGPQGTLWVREWPGSEASRKGRLTDRVARNLIVEQVELFRVQLCRLQHAAEAVGLACPGLGASVKEWDELVGQARDQLADTDLREIEER